MERNTERIRRRSIKAWSFWKIWSWSWQMYKLDCWQNYKLDCRQNYKFFCVQNWRFELWKHVRNFFCIYKQECQFWSWVKCTNIATWHLQGEKIRTCESKIQKMKINTSRWNQHKYFYNCGWRNAHMNQKSQKTKIRNEMKIYFRNCVTRIRKKKFPKKNQKIK